LRERGKREEEDKTDRWVPGRSEGESGAGRGAKQAAVGRCAVERAERGKRGGGGRLGRLGLLGWEKCWVGHGPGEAHTGKEEGRERWANRAGGVGWAKGIGLLRFLSFSISIFSLFYF